MMKNDNTHTSQKSNQKTKLALFLVPLFILLFAFLINSVSVNLYLTFFGSDADYVSLFGFYTQGAYGEWIQFASYSFAGVVGISTWRLLRESGLKKESMLIALFIIGCLFMALEEISYGQWIFGWESPAFFQEINAQKETNLHNMTFMNTHALFMIVGFFGSVAWVYKHISKRRLVTDLVCPDWTYASYFFPVFLFYLYYDYIRPYLLIVGNENFIIGNEQELFELILSFGFLLLSISNYRKVATVSMIKPILPQP